MHRLGTIFNNLLKIVGFFFLEQRFAQLGLLDVDVRNASAVNIYFNGQNQNVLNVVFSKKNIFEAYINFLIASWLRFARSGGCP